MINSKPCERRAVIDVGTNSVKLLVASTGFKPKPVLKLNRQTRLGQGAFRTGRLQPEAIARTVAAVAELAAKAAELRPTSLRILATSATREAKNGDEFIHAIRLATGLTVEVISGTQEADYTFRAVMSDPALGRRPVLVVDVGGGSTEWAVGEGAFVYFAQSTSLGTSRLLEMFPPADPPTRDDLRRCRGAIADFLRREVQPQLRPALSKFCGRPVCLVGLGGGLMSLARLATKSSTEVTAPILLRKEQLREQVERLWRLSLGERKALSGLDPAKADVILAGAVIYETVLSHFNFTELLVCSCSLASGALMTRPTHAGAQQLLIPSLNRLRHEQMANQTAAFH